MNADLTAFRKLRDLDGERIGLAAGGRTVFGVSARSGAHNGGSLFRLSADGRSLTELHVFSPGWEPSGELAMGPDGAMYGTTVGGGRHGGGIVFRYFPDEDDDGVADTLEN
jgi:uncharacterized repeat protein (TIGR03803 family)